ncbi:MAG: DDE transposase family protein [Oscillatoriales cyanobacterium RM1_1_9]|nr:DDE transposase family protein [Oscillatoriales cyanobacterium RM1_1_9]
MQFYIVKQPSGHCDIFSAEQMPGAIDRTDSSTNTLNQWGPFTSRDEAISRRVGLIRAGKCQPQ